MPAGWVEGRAVCDSLHVGIFLLENSVENKRKKKRQALDLMYESIHCVFVASAAVVASLVTSSFSAIASPENLWRGSEEKTVWVQAFHSRCTWGSGDRVNALADLPCSGPASWKTGGEQSSSKCMLIVLQGMYFKYLVRLLGSIFSESFYPLWKFLCKCGKFS